MDTRTLTHTPIAAPAAVTHTAALRPEWLRIPDAVKLFGCGRSYLYQLIAAGSIRSVCLRQRGSARGIRLISADSLSCYIEAQADADARTAAK